MYQLHANYYHRKCYLKRGQVPTQTVMKKIMSEPLAMVYFKSMTYNLKVVAGLEPPMRGGGTEWFMSPEELLAGRSVLKPIELKHLKWLGYEGLKRYGRRIRDMHYQNLIDEKRRSLEENENNWKQKILDSNRQHYEERALVESEMNTARIAQAVGEFELLYRTSVSRIEELVMDAAAIEIKRIRKDAYDYMHKRYQHLLEYQSAQIYKEYEEKILNDQTKAKAEFKKNVEKVRTGLGNDLHDLNFEKHVTVEKLRHFLQCQNLACQIYVALKEKEECDKEMEQAKKDHERKMRKMRDTIKLKDFEIRLEKEHQDKRQEFTRIWRKKICHIVKKFQLFVDYCLKLLPDHANFFLDMEKLMMLQIAATVDNPNAESIIETESGVKSPEPQPNPFHLFCDKGFTPKLDPKLCPKHCSSSASQLPVIVINRRCIYAACDNFEMFTDKVSQYISGEKGDDADIEDDHKYEGVPVKYTSTTQLEELKLESSLMQVLQQELLNARRLPIECCACQIPYCFCYTMKPSQLALPYVPQTLPEPQRRMPTGNMLTRASELQLLREPKWESYLEYVTPKKCKCAALAVKHLEEHVPPYMRKMSRYDAPNLPNYETCKIEKLKAMVKRARRIVTPPPTPEILPPRTREISTQYSDQEMENLCTCFSDEELVKFYKVMSAKIINKPESPTNCGIVDGSISPSFLQKSESSFATRRAFSLRNLLDDDPQLEEIFKKPDCECFEKYPDKRKCKPDE